MKKKVLFYFFEGMVDFEISFLIALLSAPGWDIEAIAISEDIKPVTSAYGIKLTPGARIQDIRSLSDVAGLIITGGATEGNSDELNDLIQKINHENKLLGAICFGPMQLARAGVLKGRSYTTTALPEVLKSMNLEDPFGNREGFAEKPLVRDKNIITATAAAFIDFSIEAADYLSLLSGDEEKIQLARTYKNL